MTLSDAPVSEYRGVDVVVCLGQEVAAGGDGPGVGLCVAVDLVRQAGGGEVTALLVPPRGGVAGTRAALALGAQRALVVGPEEPSGGRRERLEIAGILAAVIGRLAPDLVVAGPEPTDGGELCTPVHEVAELLGYPSITNAWRTELLGGALRAELRRRGGMEDVVCPLPALMTVAAGAGASLGAPSRPTFAQRVAARTGTLEQLTLADLGLPEGGDAVTGYAPQRAPRVMAGGPAMTGRAGVLIHDDGRAHEAVAAFLAVLELV